MSISKYWKLKFKKKLAKVLVNMQKIEKIGPLYLVNREVIYKLKWFYFYDLWGSISQGNLDRNLNDK